MQLGNLFSLQFPLFQMIRTHASDDESEGRSGRSRSGGTAYMPFQNETPPQSPRDAAESPLTVSSSTNGGGGNGHGDSGEVTIDISSPSSIYRFPHHPN